MDMVSGSIACPARGKPLSWTRSSDWAFLGYPAPGTGQGRGRNPPGGKQCQHLLDPYGRHAACCAKGLHTRRHDRIRDLIAKLARQARLTATAEQAMLIPDQSSLMASLPRAVSARFTEQTSTSLSHRAPSCGLMSRSTLSLLNTVLLKNFSEKNSLSAGHMVNETALTSKPLRRV